MNAVAAVPSPPSGPEPLGVVALLDAEPDLARWVAPDELAAARRATRVSAVELPIGPFSLDDVLALGHEGFAALVLIGLVTHEVSLGGQPALRLLGPGELLLDDLATVDTLEVASRWSASASTRLAILDDHLLVAIRRWPRLARGMLVRLHQSHATSLVQMTISQHPRVEDRVVALFRMLAARWGRVTRDGLVVPLALTHEAIGRLIGARRPTVTLALRAVSEQGRLHRRDDGTWLLGPADAPPDHLAPLEDGSLPRPLKDPGR